MLRTRTLLVTLAGGVTTAVGSRDEKERIVPYDAIVGTFGVAAADKLKI